MTASPPKLTYQDTYYAMGHFSRFLPQGATRIGLQFTAGSSPLEWAAFLVQLSDADDSWADRLALDRAQRDGVQPPAAEVRLIVFNPTDRGEELVLQAGQWFARVNVSAHSFHTLAMDAGLFEDGLLEVKGGDDGEVRTWRE